MSKNQNGHVENFTGFRHFFDSLFVRENDGKKPCRINWTRYDLLPKQRNARQNHRNVYKSTILILAFVHSILTDT